MTQEVLSQETLFPVKVICKEHTMEDCATDRGFMVVIQKSGTMTRFERFLRRSNNTSRIQPATSVVEVCFVVAVDGPKEPNPMSTCPAKHTKYNPPVEELNCPKCGATCGEFYYVEECWEETSEDCDLLHEKDQFVCSKCGHGESGSTASERIVRERDLKKCPCCKGRGYVPSDTPGSAS